MSEVKIRARIRAAVKAARRDPSPAAISKTVLRKLSDDELRPALAVALPYLVRDEIRKGRAQAIGQPHMGREKWEDIARDDTPDPADVAATSKLRRAAGRAGAKASQASRERDSALLRTPVSLGRNGPWKALGDCTPDDLRAVARSIRAEAAQREVRADGYEKLAGDLERAGADRVRDYQGEVREAFGAVLV